MIWRGQRIPCDFRSPPIRFVLDKNQYRGLSKVYYPSANRATKRGSGSAERRFFVSSLNAMKQTANTNQAVLAKRGAGSVLSEISAFDVSRHRVDELVRRAVGLRLREQDREALSRWTATRLRKLTLPGVERYGQLLDEDSAAGRRERELLTAQFSTGESYFFRDQGQFDLLAQTILPELIARRANQRRLRLWSAGCANGEEAYSLAMLIDELGPRIAGWDVLILGTDINTEALEKARRGEYRDWSFRTLDDGRKQLYFQRLGDGYQIDARLRDGVTFRRGDLVRDHFPDAQAGQEDFDLILCRNVFIYLHATAVAQITAKFSAALADGGYLVTGHSELFGHDIAPLRLRLFAQSAVLLKTTLAAAEVGLDAAPAKAVVPPVAGLPSPPRVTPPVPCSGLDAVPAMAPAAPVEDCGQLMQAAWRHADRGLREQAEQDCRQVITRAAFDPRPYFLLAQLAQERGDVIEAKTLLKKAIYLDPSFVAAYLELGALHAQAGEDQRARRMYQSAGTVLRTLPACCAIPPYGESTAVEVLAYVERLLDAPADQAAGAAMAPAQLRRSA